MTAICIVFCVLQTSLVVFLLVRGEAERMEMLDRLSAKDLREFRAVGAPSSPKGKLKKLLEDWNARRAAKEIEDSEHH